MLALYNLRFVHGGSQSCCSRCLVLWLLTVFVGWCKISLLYRGHRCFGRSSSLLLIFLVIGRICFLFVFAHHHVFEVIFVLLSKYASSFLSLRYQIVRSSEIIEFVLYNVRSALVDVDVVVSIQQLHYLFINNYLISAYDDSFLFVGVDLIVPWMSSYVFNC